MRASLLTPLLITLALAPAASAQSGARDERGAYLTIFRSPATGIELRAAHLAAFAGYYPTVLHRNGETANVNFVRLGGTYYVRPRGATPYVSPSVVWSLDSHWRNGALTEVGFRAPLGARVAGRLGAAVLTTVDGRARVNPTVGLDVALRGGR